MKRSAVPPGASINSHPSVARTTVVIAVTTGELTRIDDGASRLATPRASRQNTTVNCPRSTILSPTMAGRWTCEFVGQACKPSRCRVGCGSPEAGYAVPSTIVAGLTVQSTWIARRNFALPRWLPAATSSAAEDG